MRCLLLQVTVLDKSRADWKDFKKADDTIDEELEMHKRSGDQVGRGAGEVRLGASCCCLALRHHTSLCPGPTFPHPLAHHHCPAGCTPPPASQYLDKQAFLQQADLREYEKERDRRLASDVRNRGRL